MGGIPSAEDDDRSAPSGLELARLRLREQGQRPLTDHASGMREVSQPHPPQRGTRVGGLTDPRHIDVAARDKYDNEADTNQPEYTSHASIVQDVARLCRRFLE